MELQQSPLYLEYVKKLKWQVAQIDDVFVIYRHLFFIGGFAKLQRSGTLPPVNAFLRFIKTNRIRTIAIEPSPAVSQESLTDFSTAIKPYVRINTSPFLPTKTRILNINSHEDEIFRSFDEAKRRAVRRAEKNQITITESLDIDAMIRIKSRSAGFLGILTTYGLRHMWEIMGRNAAILLASKTHPVRDIVGGVFLVFWEKTAYYWIVGATREGKKLFAPTLLVWEAIKLAKKRGCVHFDLVGVWDERIPGQNPEWKGFSKFKAGFGGRLVHYPIAGIPLRSSESVRT